MTVAVKTDTQNDWLCQTHGTRSTKTVIGCPTGSVISG